MIQNSQRLPHIALLQTFGIFLVLLGHIIEPISRGSMWYGVTYPTNEYAHRLYEWIYSFHMPLFFFISGYLFAYKKHYNKSWFQYFKNRFQRLLIPFCLFFMFIWFPFIFLYLNSRYFPNQIDLFSFYCGHLWFLLTLFIALNIYNILLRAPIPKKNTFLAFFMVGIYYFHPSLSLSVIIYKNVLFALIFIHFGYLFASYFGHNNDDTSNKKPFCFQLILLEIICILFILLIFMRSVYDFERIFSEIYIVLFPLLMITLFNVIAFGTTYIFRLLNNNKIITYISKNLLIIYLWHFPFCIACHHILMDKPGIEPIVNIFIVLIGSILPIEIYNRLKKYSIPFKRKIHE